VKRSETTYSLAHERFMRRCIELAQIAQRQHNTPVGSVVVLDGDVVGEGIEDLPAGDSVVGHAEVLACQKAVDHTGSRRLAGATLYTTAEPCFMCSYIIRQCEISLVVYGRDTPGVGGATSSHPILTDTSMLGWKPAPHVIGGVLRRECQHID
jgi:tRNA(adenine34) deaminase